MLLFLLFVSLFFHLLDHLGLQLIMRRVSAVTSMGMDRLCKGPGRILVMSQWLEGLIRQMLEGYWASWRHERLLGLTTQRRCASGAVAVAT